MIWTVLKLFGVILLTLAFLFLLAAAIHRGLLEYEHYQWKKRWKLDQEQRRKWGEK